VKIFLKFGLCCPFSGLNFFVGEGVELCSERVLKGTSVLLILSPNGLGGGLQFLHRLIFKVILRGFGVLGFWGFGVAI